MFELLFGHVQASCFNSCGNLFSMTNGTWELIFEGKALFEISENNENNQLYGTVILFNQYWLCGEFAKFSSALQADLSNLNYAKVSLFFVLNRMYIFLLHCELFIIQCM